MTSFVSVFCKKSGFSPRLTLSLRGRIEIETRPTISYLNVRGIQLNCHGNLLVIFDIFSCKEAVLELLEKVSVSRSFFVKLRSRSKSQVRSKRLKD